jgi:hypothetical protein
MFVLVPQTKHTNGLPRPLMGIALLYSLLYFIYRLKIVGFYCPTEVHFCLVCRFQTVSWATLVSYLVSIVGPFVGVSYQTTRIFIRLYPVLTIEIGGVVSPFPHTSGRKTFHSAST